MKRVLVVWQDSSCEDGVLTAEGAQNLNVYQVITCGFLMLDTKDKVVLCMEEFVMDDGGKRYRHMIVIPRPAVMSITELK